MPSIQQFLVGQRSLLRQSGGQFDAIEPSFYGTQATQITGPLDSIDPDLLPLTDVGFRSFRDATNSVLRWRLIETAKGIYNWAVLDAQLDYLEAQLPGGTHVLLSIFGLPTDWTPVTGDFAEFIGVLAERLLQRDSSLVFDFGIWNEPDGAFWAGTVAEFADIIDGAVSTWRSIMPAASLVIAPPVTSATDSIDWYRELFATGVFDGAERPDAISCNPYDDPNEPEHLLTHLARFGSFAREVGLPIMATEYTSHAFKINGGVTQTFPTLMDDEEGASRVARMWPMFIKAGFQRLYFYGLDLWMDVSNGATVTVNGAYSCIRFLAQDGTKLAPALVTEYQIALIENWRDVAVTTALWLWRFKARDGRTGSMIWRPAGQSGSVDLTVYSTATDMYGAAVTLVNNYALTHEPVYCFD
jgi:hypothetical protein